MYLEVNHLNKGGLLYSEEEDISFGKTHLWRSHWQGCSYRGCRISSLIDALGGP